MTSRQADRLHVGLEILSRAQDESHRHFLLRQWGGARDHLSVGQYRKAVEEGGVFDPCLTEGVSGAHGEACV